MSDEKIVQALRELFVTWLESRPSFRTTVEVDAAWEGWKANTAVAAMLATHESRAQPASVADGWQPMETAPKGGGAERTDDPAYIKPPRILIRFGDEAMSVAYWDWYYAEGGNGFRDGFAWIEPCSGEPLNLHYTTPPDGWMSLDAAPQPAKGDEE